MEHADVMLMCICPLNSRAASGHGEPAEVLYFPEGALRTGFFAHLRGPRRAQRWGALTTPRTVKLQIRSSGTVLH